MKYPDTRSLGLPLVLSLSLVTSGCSSLAVGEKRFGCQGHPSDPLCLPASRVYDLTNGTDSAVDPEAAAKTPKRPTNASHTRRVAAMGFLGEDAELFGVTPASKTLPDSADPAPATGIAETDPDPIPLPEEDLLLPRSHDPIPLRVPAQVMRIWLAPWEDERGDLHASGYVFTEIAPRTWSLAAGPDQRSTAWLTPLQVEARANPNPEGQAPSRAPVAIPSH